MELTIFRASCGEEGKVALSFKEWHLLTVKEITEVCVAKALKGLLLKVSVHVTHLPDASGRESLFPLGEWRQEEKPCLRSARLCSS